MKPSTLKYIFLLTSICLQLSLFAQHSRFISMQQQTEILEGNRKNTSTIDIYFDNQKHTLTRHFHSPKELIASTNSFGEIKTYNPVTHEVSYQHFPGLSSKSNLVYYFVNNITQHLGLAEQGFALNSSYSEDQHYITIWDAPVSVNNVASVKMAHQHGLPVYSEYRDNNENALKKTYYTNYHHLPGFRFPERIIDITYQPSGDSTITRTTYINIEVSENPHSDLFNFEIPENATSVEIE